MRGVVALAGRFGGNENRVDLGKNLRVIKSHGPAALIYVIVVQNAEPMSRLFDSGSFAPNVEHYACVEPSGIRQIVGIEDKRFPFDIKDPAKGALTLTFVIGVIDIDDVKVPCGHEIANLAPRGFHVQCLLQVGLGFL